MARIREKPSPKPVVNAPNMAVSFAHVVREGKPYKS